MDQLAAYIDCSTMRLGDRMACAWWAQRRRLDEGLRFGLIDRNERLTEPFPLHLYFPETFTALTPNQVDQLRLPLWDQGNLWLTVTNAFANCPVAGHFEHLPSTVEQAARQLRAEHGPTPRVLIHVLDDAQYNKARNWLRKDVDQLLQLLRQHRIEPVLLNPEAGHFLGGYTHMLAQMLASDLFIGGDTGPSHVFALLCSDRPQVALYPDMTRDQRKFQKLQSDMELAHPWNSLPKRPDLNVVRLGASRHLKLDRRGLGFDRVGRIPVEQLAALVTRIHSAKNETHR